MKKKHNGVFDNYEVEPSKDVWKKIESQLPKARSRRWIIWIIPALLVLSSGLFFGLRNYKTDVKTASPALHSSLPVSKEDAQTTGGGDALAPVNSNPKPDDQFKITNSTAGKKEKKYFSNSSNSTNQNLSEEKPTDVTGLKQENNILTDESAVEMEMIRHDFQIDKSETKISERETKIKFIKPVTRWTLFAGAGVSYSNSRDVQMSSSEATNVQTKGIRDWYFSVGAGYDVSTRFRLTAGINFLKAGQEQSSTTKVYLHGIPGDPNNTYSFNSTLGNLSVSGSEFDRALFGTVDSALFVPMSNLYPGTDTVRETYMTVRQEFSTIQFPISILYKAVEGKFTPVAGVYISPGIVKKQYVYLNDERIDYEYEGGVSNFIFSAGLTAGVEYHLSRVFGVYLNGFYQRSFDSVIKEYEWKPFITGVSAGVSYRLR